MRNFFLVCFLYISITLTAQTSFTISGSVKDEASKEGLVGANVYLKENANGVSSDADGRFRFSEKQGKYTLICSYIGYEQYEKTITLNQNLTLDIKLKPVKFTMEGVEVLGEYVDKNVRGAEISTIELPMKRIEAIPVLFGEMDILKTVQLLPGIQSGGEGSNSFYVRGGGADQNLILLDNATVYNPSHLFGFFSVFNGDVVNTVEILKGGIAPEYGGRMSSVLNITSKDGDFQKYKEEFGVGLISARIKAEGPIQKEKSSFMFAARRTYVDVLLKPFSKGTDMEGIGYHFYDLNGKMTFRLSPKDHLYVSGYYGRDVFGFHPKESNMTNDINWSNGFATARWTHSFNNKLYLNTSAIFTDYRFFIKAKEDVYNMKLYSGVQDWQFKSDLVWSANPLNKVKGGVDYIFHTFTPTTASASSNEVDFDLGDPEKMYAHDLSFYLQHEYDPLDWLKIVYGVRYNYFAQTGPFTRYEIDNIYDLNNIDSTIYGKGKVVQAYNMLEPRINFRFQLDRNKSLKASYTLNHQCVNLVSMSSMSLPTDVWFPATALVKPQRSNQFALGYFQNFAKNTIETSVETYYKLMDNLIEYRTGADIINIMQTNYDHSFAFGKGKSYGVEFFVNKTSGRFTGWVGYTLSWTTRNFDEIMNGKTFYARFDRRHDASILLSYQLSEKWNLSAVWVFSTGNASTIPNAFYFMEGKIITEWGEHNAWRMPNYHRLDLSATLSLFKKQHTEGNLNFSVYNAYNRKNPYYISYQAEGNLSEGRLQINANQISIFPILPSVAFNMKIF